MVTPEFTAPTVTGEVPANLPTGAAEALQFVVSGTQSDEVLDTESELLKNIEDHAHAQNVLLSSDAVRELATQVTDPADLSFHLDAVLEAARGQFPSDDGWLV